MGRACTTRQLGHLEAFIELQEENHEMQQQLGFTTEAACVPTEYTALVRGSFAEYLNSMALGGFVWGGWCMIHYVLMRTLFYGLRDMCIF